MEKYSNNYHFRAPDKIKISKESKSLFLAGSIEMGAAENWQDKIVLDLESEHMVTILNPRKEDWDSSWVQSINEPKFYEQVTWELNSLEKAGVIAMYFDPNTKSPISLLELGLYASSGKLVVYCPDGFYRKGNVDIVCRKYGIPVHINYDTWLINIKNKLNSI